MGHRPADIGDRKGPALAKIRLERGIQIKKFVGRATKRSLAKSADAGTYRLLAGIGSDTAQRLGKHVGGRG
jgi:hypothetical protein